VQIYNVKILDRYKFLFFANYLFKISLITNRLNNGSVHTVGSDNFEQLFRCYKLLINYNTNNCYRKILLRTPLQYTAYLQQRTFNIILVKRTNTNYLVVQVRHTLSVKKNI